MHGLYTLFSRSYPRFVVALLQQQRYRVGRFLVVFWKTNNLATIVDDKPYQRTAVARSLEWFVLCAVATEVLLGLVLIAWAIKFDMVGGWLFGASFIIVYPVVAAHMLVLVVLVAKLVHSLLHPKTAGKAWLCDMLEWQVLRLRQKNDFKVVAVVGSVGKTSTKLAIAHTLAAHERVVYQDGNYNDRLTVPLVIFGQSLPGLLNLVDWLKVLLANERTIRRDFACDIAVLELGTDRPGQITQFAYLQPDVTVITAITPEHMEFFKTLDAVATEELTVTEFSKLTIVNGDDTPDKYLVSQAVETYGMDEKATYRITNLLSNGLDGLTMKLRLGEHTEMFASPMLGVTGAKITAAAAITAQQLGLAVKDIAEALRALPPTPGRMQIIAGLQGSTIIDDTYNASPVAIKAGLDVLAATRAPRRIVILGSMNELGDYSQQAHEEVGSYCNPASLGLVVTIGTEAEKYLAPAARVAGCQVESFLDPYKAGAFVKDQLVRGAVVLAEGSQNGVFAEEAIKQLLQNSDDSCKLVRQSPYWRSVKNRQFPQH
jgi:UDP-N-acetylmuramoyl-tripeptide--D-alanyl-D-alanine ligase